MYVSMRDGRAVFGMWLLRGGKTPGSFDIREEGTVCYSDEEREAAERILRERGISYILEPITVDDSLKAKAEGIKYASRSEILAHLESDLEPENIKIVRLAEKVGILENSLLTAQTHIADLCSELQSVKQTLADTRII